MIYRRVIEELKYNKYLRESGKKIAIPFPFERFSNYFPGIQKGRYHIVTANSKVGKTKITDFLYAYNVVERVISEGIKAKILYFSLEVSKEEKIKEVISHKLYTSYGISLSPEQLSSMFSGYILNDSVLNIIQSKKFTEWLATFESIVEIIDTKRSGKAIFSEVLRYAANNGRYVDRWGNELNTDKIHANDSKELSKVDVFLPKDPDEYVIPIFDHGSLLAFQEDGYSDLRLALNDFSSFYCLYMRDRLKYSPVLIQQQAAGQESTENFKLNLLQPSASGLGDSKVIGRDCNVMLGLFAPSRYKIREYKNYDTAVLNDHYRELSIILNRHGPAVNADLYFNGASNFFCELPKSEEFLTDPTLYAKYSR